jgi:hypothetical protein
MRSLPALALIFAAACGDAGVGPEDITFGPEIPAANVLIETTHSGFEVPFRSVVRSAAEWDQIRSAFADAHPGAPPLPTVDFARDMVVAAAMGIQDGGGFRIEIASALFRPASIDVTVRDVIPAVGCEHPTIPTTPFTAVRIPRSERTVRFIDAARIADC